MAVTFGGAVSAAAPAVYDTTVSQATGACCEGIGLIGADGVALTGSPVYIGGTVAPIKFDTNQTP